MLLAHVETSSAESPHAAVTGIRVTSYLSHRSHPPSLSHTHAHTLIDGHTYGKNHRVEKRAHTGQRSLRQLPRTNLTSLKDSHLPNCVPPYLFSFRTYLDYTVYACVTAPSIGPDPPCRQMIHLVTLSLFAAFRTV